MTNRTLEEYKEEVFDKLSEEKKLEGMYQMSKAICEAIEYIKTFNIDKAFSFPLMKRWEENQVKSSIDYEFKHSLYKELLAILEGSDSND